MSARVATLGLTVVVGVMLVSLSRLFQKIYSIRRRYPAAERGMAKSGSSAPIAPSSGSSMPGARVDRPGRWGRADRGGIGSTFPDLSLWNQGAGPRLQCAERIRFCRRGQTAIRGAPGREGERCWRRLSRPKVLSDRSKISEESKRKEQAASAQAGLNDVFFGYDSWTISEDGRQALMQDAQWIKSNSGAIVKIEGHCDERGTLAYNLVLGEKRAKAVRNYLVELGISANRLSVVSYGKERPFCNDHNEGCYQQNRRDMSWSGRNNFAGQMTCDMILRAIE